MPARARLIDLDGLTKALSSTPSSTMDGPASSSELVVVSLDEGSAMVALPTSGTSFPLVDPLLDDLIRPAQRPTLRWAAHLTRALELLPSAAHTAALRCVRSANASHMSRTSPMLFQHCRQTHAALRDDLRKRGEL